LQENALRFAEVAVIGTTVYSLGVIFAKIMGLTTPISTREKMNQALIALGMFTMVFLGGYLGAMSTSDQNKPGSATELLGCLVGSVCGVIFDLVILHDIQKEEVKNKPTNKIEPRFRS